MCGIAAMIGSADMITLKRMLANMQHRGPDQIGTIQAHRAALGINRLRIVGGHQGRQPITGRDSRRFLICNGQIYNHTAIKKDMGTTNLDCHSSDVAVVLSLYETYGLEGFDKLSGIFAFVIYDSATNEFVAGRDRYGVKPLYYLKTPEVCYFASEVKAFSGLGQDLKNIREVPPGQLYTAGGLVTRKANIAKTLDDPTPAKLLTLLKRAVEAQMQADDDIRFGVLLSGGLDSSLLAALASKCRGNLVAFTTGMEGSSDVAAARLVAEYLGIELVVCRYSPSDLLEDIKRAVAVTESYNVAIVLEGILTSLMAEAAQSLGVKVLLSGEGADELFGGYGFLRELEDDARRESMRSLMENIGNTECKRLDRATMAHGVEARVPYLDQDLAAWAMNLPSDLLVRQRDGRIVSKWILRAAAQDLLPDAIIDRSKLAMDHGSGILSKVDHVCSSVTDLELIQGQNRYPSANLRDRISLLLYRVWREVFDDAGGTRMYELFGDYPQMQPALLQEVYTRGGTGESLTELEVLNAEIARPVSMTAPANRYHKVFCAVEGCAANV